MMSDAEFAVLKMLASDSDSHGISRLIVYAEKARTTPAGNPISAVLNVDDRSNEQADPVKVKLIDILTQAVKDYERIAIWSEMSPPREHWTHKARALLIDLNPAGQKS